MKKIIPILIAILICFGVGCTASYFQSEAILNLSLIHIFFPSLSFSTGQNVTNRPYQETSNTVSGTEIISSDSKTTYNGNYGLNAQWTLWNGNKRLNAIKQKKTSQQIAGLTVAETENSLQEQIAQIFIQILYADESVKINQNTLQVSQATYDRGKELFHKGSISKADLAQLESQVGSDKYQLVISESSLRDYKLQLKQLLELDGTEEMDLVLPEFADEHVLQPLPAQEDVYQQALASRPELQSSKLSIENSKLDISVAKAGYLPTISLSASTGSMTNSASDKVCIRDRKYIGVMLREGLPVPVLSAALNYFLGLTTNRSPANMIQAMRDYFGAHTFERVDSPRGEFFHEHWEDNY